MFLARFSYDILPVNRHRALELIQREVEAARASGLKARLLVPLTRAHGGAALQFEVELTAAPARKPRRATGCTASAKS